jgi:hypothetical protein
MRARTAFGFILFSAVNAISGRALADPLENTKVAREDLPDSDGDVVFDNRALRVRQAEERREQYQGDSPFADAMPADERGPAGPDRGTQERSSTRFRPVALTLNPLTLALGRIGLNVEALPAPHHGIMLNPYYSSASVESETVETSYKSFGGELGYHFYSGARGANGFFVGPSLVFTRTTISDECRAVGCTKQADGALTTYGVAFDVGGQAVLDNGFTIGGGGGVMYLKSSSSANGSRFLKFEGTLPRFLFTVGYSI